MHSRPKSPSFDDLTLNDVLNFFRLISQDTKYNPNVIITNQDQLLKNTADSYLKYVRHKLGKKEFLDEEDAAKASRQLLIQIENMQNIIAGFKSNRKINLIKGEIAGKIPSPFSDLDKTKKKEFLNSLRNLSANDNMTNFNNLIVDANHSIENQQWFAAESSLRKAIKLQNDFKLISSDDENYNRILEAYANLAQIYCQVAIKYLQEDTLDKAVSNVKNALFYLKKIPDDNSEFKDEKKEIFKNVSELDAQINIRMCEIAESGYDVNKTLLQKTNVILNKDKENVNALKFKVHVADIYRQVANTNFQEENLDKAVDFIRVAMNILNQVTFLTPELKKRKDKVNLSVNKLYNEINLKLAEVNENKKDFYFATILAIKALYYLLIISPDQLLPQYSEKLIETKNRINDLYDKAAEAFLRMGTNDLKEFQEKMQKIVTQYVTSLFDYIQVEQDPLLKAKRYELINKIIFNEFKPSSENIKTFFEKEWQRINETKPTSSPLPKFSFLTINTNQDPPHLSNSDPDTPKPKSGGK